MPRTSEYARKQRYQGHLLFPPPRDEDEWVCPRCQHEMFEDTPGEWVCPVCSYTIEEE